LHRGLDVGVPNLILRSDHSVTEAGDAVALQRGDAVLDVRHIARWAGCIGNRSIIVPVADAKHDVFLSMTRPRQVAYQQLDTWLDDYLGAASNAASQNG
jgi:alpha-beta hydrolase superfamily lysophospholipase